MTTITGSNLRRGMVAVLVCLSFVLQQTLIPLHLALNEHTLPAPGGSSAHSGAGHAPGDPLHVHAYVGIAGALADASGGRGDDHEPHPAEDHLDSGIGELVLPLLARLPAVLAPATVELPVAPALRTRLVRRAEHRPPSPPPRGPTEPRAPPAAV